MTAQEGDDSSSEGKASEPWPAYRRLTESQIHQLAIDWMAGQIWSDRDGDPKTMFMFLAFAPREALVPFLESLGPMGMVYEHASKAGPLAINGQPTFFSCQFLDTEDVERLKAKLQELAPPPEASPDSSESHEQKG